ncbi:MAG: YitT family protein [Clostridia bacterium]
MKTKGGAIRRAIFAYIIIIIGGFLKAISTYTFTVPAKFIPGGVVGIASFIETLFGFSSGYLIAIINVPILVLAILFLDRKLAIRTAFGILCLTGFMELFKIVDLYRFLYFDQPILTAIIAGCLSGVGTGLLLNETATPGGTEVIGLLIQKRAKNIKISQILLAMNVFVILLGGIMYFFVGNMSIDTIIVILTCSFIQVSVNSKSVDMIVNGLNSAVKFEIITKKGDELSTAIITELEYGVTVIKSRGAYTDEESSILVCVVPKLRISAFKRIVQAVDKTAFVYSVETREVMGKNFKKRV